MANIGGGTKDNGSRIVGWSVVVVVVIGVTEAGERSKGLALDEHVPKTNQKSTYRSTLLNGNLISFFGPSGVLEAAAAADTAAALVAALAFTAPNVFCAPCCIAATRDCAACAALSRAVRAGAAWNCDGAFPAFLAVQA